MSEAMRGKVILMTGATDGLGKAGALALARQGASLTLLARDPAKGAAVVDELKAQSGNPDIGLTIGDLGAQADVRAVAARFHEGHDRLDVLINNAGSIFTTRRLSPDGYELTFAINHLGPFLLSNLVLDLLQKTPGARVVNTSSDAYRSSKLDLGQVVLADGKFGAFPAYADSKLCNLLFTRELQRRVGSAVSVSCFHPGFVGTNIGANNGGFMARVWKAVGALIAKSPEQGADTLVWLATRPDAAFPDGGYYIDRKLVRPSKLGEDDNLAGELWVLSERLCGLAG